MKTNGKAHIYKTVLNCGTNENGSVLLTTVIILLLLTLIGVSGINTASTDLQITRNYRIYKENLMLSDAAVNRGSKEVINALSEEIIGRAWVDDLDGVYLVDDLLAKDADKYFKDSDYDPYITPVTNELETKEVLTIVDWDGTDTTGNKFDPEPLASEPEVQWVAFMQLETGAEPEDRQASAVVIARSQKNGGDVVIEAGVGRDD